MKSVPVILAVALVASARAQAPALPSFAPEKLGLPSLSLRDAIAANDSTLEPRSRLPGTLPQPHTFLDRAALTATSKPEEKSGPRMRVIAPDSTVDYKMRIVVPSADIDPKMIVGGGGEESHTNR